MLRTSSQQEHEVSDSASHLNEKPTCNKPNSQLTLQVHFQTLQNTQQKATITRPESNPILHSVPFACAFTKTRTASRRETIFPYRAAVKAKGKKTAQLQSDLFWGSTAFQDVVSLHQPKQPVQPKESVASCQRVARA